MKKIILTGIFNLIVLVSFSQSSFDARLTTNEQGYLVYQIKQTAGTTNPDATHLIGDITFSISWLQTLGSGVDVRLLCTTNDYNIEEEGNGKRTDNGTGVYYRKDATYSSNNFAPPENWVNGTWYTIATFKVTNSGSGTGDFSIYTSDGFNFSFDEDGSNTITSGENFTPTINGSDGTVSSYSFPTEVYAFVWKGGLISHGHDYGKIWEYGGNWQDECGNDRSGDDYPYQLPDNVVIPDVSSGSAEYPEQTGNWNDGWYCNNLKILNNAHITVPDLSGNSHKQLTVNGNLIVQGKLYLPALGYATVTGSTDIEDASGIEVQADATGVGSFIDNGTITYGTSGSAKVQTYLTNTTTSGNWYIHTVGPTVDIGGVGGANLSNFNVSSGNTYAYKWDGTQDTTVASAWINIFTNTYLVATGDGIAMATDDSTAYTMNMTGSLITGNITSYSFSNTANNNSELISNPYPSAIDFDALYNNNNSIVNNKTWIWDPSAGTYATWSSGTGNQYIQVGQGFFVETKAGGTFSFTNSERVHNNVAFRETNANELTMKVSGGDFGFKDELVVRFVEDATYGYDPEIDAYKMNSMYDDATQIESVAEDNSKLAINFLPIDGLQGDMVSVPVNFNCGYTAEYTFDFEGIDSFEAGNEVWLEDKKDNDKWIYLNNNPHYTFTATSYEPNDRFIIHFFGPTSINDKDEAKVDIYSWRQYAFINNVTNEKIKKVSIYNMAGSLVTEREIPNGQKLSKIWVSDHMAYYVVQVITEKSVYTNKILITK